MLRRTGQQLGASLARKLEVTLELTQNVGDHLVAVRCKLGRVEMNMRVDQHRNPPPQEDAMVSVP